MKNCSIPIISLSILLASCIPLPDGPGNRVTDLPKLSNLTGKYVLTSESEKLLQNAGFPQFGSDPENFIILNSDGSCVFEGWSTYNALSSKTERKHKKTTGIWKFSSVKEIVVYIAVDLDLKTTEQEEIRKRFWLAKIKNEYVLWDWASDPDERRYCIFKKER